jgi:hypothetical protein
VSWWAAADKTGAAMFGLGFQEQLIILLLLVLFLVVLPTVTYLIASLFLKGFGLSPRRSLLALWLLVVVYAALMHASDREVNLFIGTVILGPVGIALNVGWLWFVGCFWWRVSLFRVGAAWQNTAALLFRAVRPVAAQ